MSDNIPFYSISLLERLTRIVPNLIYIFNVRTKTNEYANKSLGEAIGYSAREIKAMGENFLSIVCHPDDLPRIIEHFGELQLLKVGESRELEYRVKNRAGNYQWFLSVDSVFEKNGNSELEKIIGVASDITAIKRREKELHKVRQENVVQTHSSDPNHLNEELERRVAERTQALQRSNEVLERFVFAASHDLNSPLRAVSNLVRWIEEDVADMVSPSSKRHFVQLKRRIIRMEKLLAKLIHYSTTGHKKDEVEEVDTKQVVLETLQLLDTPESFSISVSDKLPIMKLAKAPFAMVVRNLMENAVEHNPSNKGEIVISAREENSQVEFAIQDNGPGIDPRYQEQIFDMFEMLQPKDAVEGSGLGLAIVKKIVEENNGSVRVTSEKGKGATFYFTWPSV